MGLQDIAEEGENVPRTKLVLKETILHDVQFRGAISDFHPFKPQIANADYDPILCRYNVDDRYDDGNNFEVCQGKSKISIKYRAIIYWISTLAGLGNIPRWMRTG